MDRILPALDFIILSGEPSGDLHGASLIEELLKINPHFQIGAVAGPCMRKHQIYEILAMEKLQVMGFIDVFFALPRILKLFFILRSAILELNPKTVVFIDYPGLHLQLAKSLRKKGFQGKLVHYICPSVWAWKKRRIQTCAENLDLLLSIFPFEKPYFAHTTLEVAYIGNPLVTQIPEKTRPSTNILALFPGSRDSEITKNLPLQLQVAKALQKKYPELEIQISVAAKEKIPLIASFCEKETLVLPDCNHNLMARARLGLAVSGTVTLELALHKTPTIVQYAMRPLDLFLAQKIFRIKLPFYCIVNLIAGKQIFPEFFGPNVTFDNLFNSAEKLLLSPQETQEKCAQIRHILGSQNASQAAAKIINSVN